MWVTVCRCEPAPVFSALVKKSKAKHINRERKAIKSARFKLRGIVRKYLKHVAPNIARQVTHTRTLLGKAEEGDDDAIERILASLSLDWAVLASDMTPVIQRILEDSGAEALAQIDVTTERALELVNEHAVSYSKERAADLVTNISESTRGMLRSDIADAMKSGASNDALAKAIEANYGFSSARAEMIARTETAYADTHGNLEAYHLSGVVASKQWITGSGCCDLCDELSGEVVPLDEPFKTEDGEIDIPPLHPNCRCDYLPITFEAAGNDPAQD